MEVKIFTDVIDALEKTAKAVIAIKDVPKAKRKVYRDAVRDSFSLLDSAITLVLNRLGDLIQIASSGGRGKFVSELRNLEDAKDWTSIERDVRLCSNLRVTHGEMHGLTMKVMTKVSGRDWENTRKLVDKILEKESTLADFISGSLKELAEKAPAATKSAEAFTDAVAAVTKVRNSLKGERERLIRAEVSFLGSF